MVISLDLGEFCCPNESCEDHGKKGQGNIVLYHTYGKNKRNLLKCRTCHVRFSERHSTFCFGLHTQDSKIREVILHLMEGMSFREAATASNLDKDTVQRIWKRFMLYCEESMESLLKEFNIQLEDLIMFLHKRIQTKVK